MTTPQPRPRTIRIDGQVRTFPPGTTDEQIVAILTQERAAPPMPAAPQPAPQPTAADWVRKALQGTTAGFGDELLAGVRSAFTGVPYDTTVADERRRLQQVNDAAPMRGVAAEVAGSLPLALLPGMQTLRNAPLLSRVGRGLLTGAIEGGVAGAGAGEGEDRVRTGAQGMALGAAVGGAFPVAGAIGRSTAQMAATAAPDSMIGRLAARVPGVVPPGNARASELTMEALAADGMTPQAVLARMRAAGNKPVTVADVAGENTRSLGDAAMTVPSSGRAAATSFLDDRAAAQSERVVADINRLTGVSQDFASLTERLMAQRSAAAAPAYQRAYQQGSVGVDDPRVLKLLQIPHVQAAYQQARQIAALTGEQLPEVIDAAGNIVQLPDLRTLDLVKMGLDEIIERRSISSTDKIFGGSGTSLGNHQIGALKQVRRQLVETLDEIFPAYQHARSVYAGPSRMIEAMQAGREFVDADPRQLAHMLSHEYRTPADRDFFRIGALDEIRRRISAAPDSADVYKRVFGSDQKRKILEQFFPDSQAYQQFVEAMSLERAMRRTEQMVRGNSSTARRLNEASSLKDGVMTFLMSPAEGARQVQESLSRRAAARNADKILPAVFGQMQDAETILPAMQDWARKRANARTRVNVPGLLGRVAGLEQK